MNSFKKINPHILIICAFVTSLTACNSFDKDFIANFDVNKRTIELKIDSLAKQKATFEYAMEQLNEEYTEKSISGSSSILNAYNPILGEVFASSRDKYYEYLAYSLKYEYMLDEEAKAYVEEFESKDYNSSHIESATEALPKYRTMMAAFCDRLVLSPLKESSRGEDYIIYIIAFENNDVSTKMTIKVKFDVNKLYSEWQEI